MTQKFVERLFLDGIVDTRKYRYVLTDHGYKVTIKRLPIEHLDTTAAIDGWELVKEIDLLSEDGWRAGEDGCKCAAGTKCGDAEECYSGRCSECSAQ